MSRSDIPQFASSTPRGCAAGPSVTQPREPVARFEKAIPVVLTSMHAGLSLTDEEALFLVQPLYILVTGHALAEFGEAPEPPAAPQAYYDAWFDIAVSTFLAGVQARHGAG
jgi:hypothetical protein